MTDLLLPARKIKHAGFMGLHHGRRVARAVTVPARDAYLRRRESVAPFVYRSERYADTFLAAPTPVATGHSRLPRVLWCLWTGDNPLTPNRAAALESIRRVHEGTDVQVRFVTPETLHQWVLPEHPLHPAYEHLSLVHRSDYLRCYLLAHHGGGYADMKRLTTGWAAAFGHLETERHGYLLGYPEVSASMTGARSGRLGRDVRRHFPVMVGTGGFIARSQTPLTREWFAQVTRILDTRTDALARHPGGVWGDAPGYPLRWLEILAEVLHPLQLKYHRHLVQDETVKPVLVDYK